MTTYTIPESGRKKSGRVSPSSTAEGSLSPLLTPGETVTSWTDDDVMHFLIYEVLRMKKEKDDENNEIETTVYRDLIENGINSPKFC